MTYAPPIPSDRRCPCGATVTRRAVRDWEWIVAHPNVWHRGEQAKPSAVPLCTPCRQATPEHQVWLLRKAKTAEHREERWRAVIVPVIDAARRVSRLAAPEAEGFDPEGAMLEDAHAALADRFAEMDEFDAESARKRREES